MHISILQTAPYDMMSRCKNNDPIKKTDESIQRFRLLLADYTFQDNSLIMKIWVDADACPQVVKQILYKAADRKKLPLILVANHFFQTPPSPFISKIQVEKGFDVADDYIAMNVTGNDLVITGDIPLADEIISKGAKVMTPRGEILDKENIKARLTIRDFNDNLRSSGIQTKGPPPLNQKDRQQFANALDRMLSRI